MFLTLAEAAKFIPGADANTLKRMHRPRTVDAFRTPAVDSKTIESILSELDGTEMVYFVGFREFVKIGYSTQLGARLSQLNMLPEPLAILHFENGTIRDERAYHKRFAHLRTYGEWFYHSADIAKFLSDKPLTRTVFGNRHK